MIFRKKAGKYKFEASISKFQLIGILIWSFALLLLPIAVDQFLTFKDSIAVGSEAGENIAGLFTDEENFFTYTIDIRERKELISALTLVIGSISTVTAVIAGIYLLKDSTKKNSSIFISE